jgi:N-acetylglucosaminyl-diphospho-decaprenol L-rhamnosyltransferase
VALDLSIIIVSWNVADLLAACLDSINANQGTLALEVIVVDSASSDHSADLVRERYPWVWLLAQPENVGFTRGNNIGLQVAGGRHLLLLNPDTEVIGDMLTQMVATLDANPDVGIVGPHTLNTDGSTQSSRRRFPTLTVAFLESTWLQPFAPPALLDRYYVRDVDDRATADVDWVQGHALMARREVYAGIGGLDTGYVMYFEELDWCKRAKSAGWRVVYLGSAQVTHHGGRSSAQVGAFKHIQFNRSKIRYLRKYHGAAAAGLLRAFLLLGFAYQIALEGAKWLLRHKPHLRRERLVVYWQVLRSGLR